MEKIRLLIVDDSAFLRSNYQRMLQDVKEIEVVDTAKNGKEAVEKALSLDIDVITMDIEMPLMNGLDAVREILKEKFVSILMVSSLTKEGADATIEALNRGALDFVAKETAFSKVSSMKDELVEKILRIGQNTTLKNKILRRTVLNKEQKHSHHPTSETSSRVISNSKETRATVPVNSNYDNFIQRRDLPKKSQISALSIGISTGGPVTLQNFLPKLLPSIRVPIFIVQHMPPNFTRSLAERLNNSSPLEVKEAENGDLIKGGCVYIGPGGKQMLVSHGKIVITDKKPENELYSPSFNIALGSQIHEYNSKILALVMTGMGHDGTQAMTKLHEIGGFNVAQDPDTCVISGMPNSAIKANVVHKIVPLDKIAEFLNNILA